MNLFLLNKKRRTVLFFLSLLFFLVSGIVVLAQSNGYRFDFQKKRFVLVGAIQLKIKPEKDISLYLNGKKRDLDKLGFFGNTYLVDNLLPRKYQVTIKKEGYFSWQKNLPVEEKMTTLATSIILLPKKIKGEKIISVSKKGEIIPLKDNYFLLVCQKEIYLQKKGIKKPIKIISLKEEIKEKSLNQKRDILFLKTKDNYYLLDLSRFFSDQKITTLFLNSIIDKKLRKNLKDILFVKEDGKIILVFEDKISFFDWQEKEIKEEFSLKGKEKIERVFFEKGNIFFQDKEGNLFLFLPKKGETKKIASNTGRVLFLSLSPDKNKLILSLEGKIYLLYLKNYFEDFIRKKGEMDLLSQKETKKIRWHQDSNHFWQETKSNELIFSEIDPRENINTFVWQNIENFFYKEKENILYFQKGNTLLSWNLND